MKIITKSKKIVKLLDWLLNTLKTESHSMCLAIAKVFDIIIYIDYYYVRRYNTSRSSGKEMINYEFKESFF